MSMGNERRGAPRAEASLPLRLSPDATAQPATLRNLSTTGLCCDSPVPLDEMALMGIQLELSSQAHDIKGVVVRCDKHDGAVGYEVAIYFTEVAPATRKAIGDFVVKRLEAV
ncbi:MAG: PilZ domain-containing protein [Planctomycetota bacterium]